MNLEGVRYGANSSKEVKKEKVSDTAQPIVIQTNSSSQKLGGLGGTSTSFKAR
jgi:hypothetical protein